jgi:predicted GNAT superfamily acetyltransferase
MAAQSVQANVKVTVRDVRVGGLVLGAFDDADHLVGFAFAFLGRLRDNLVLYSQLTGVDPDRQASGIGRAIKFEQRRRARAMGLESVVWAFDPLQASNAAFNLAVLGATSRTYEVDLYGTRSDALNVGLATDRLLAEWPTNGEPLYADSAHWSEAAGLVQSVPISDGIRTPIASPTIDDQRITIEIPRDLSAVKRTPELAKTWQASIREAFTTAFESGYVAVGFSRADPLRPRYLLERRA